MSDAVYTKHVELNNGHDGVDIEAYRGYGEGVQITFSGRDPSKVTINLIELADVEAVAGAMMAAVEVLRSFRPR